MQNINIPINEFTISITAVALIFIVFSVWLNFYLSFKYFNVLEINYGIGIYAKFGKNKDKEVEMLEKNIKIAEEKISIQKAKIDHAENMKIVLAVLLLTLLLYNAIRSIFTRPSKKKLNN